MKESRASYEQIFISTDGWWKKYSAESNKARQDWGKIDNFDEKWFYVSFYRYCLKLISGVDIGQ